jgi:hypothetical protein
MKISKCIIKFQLNFINFIYYLLLFTKHYLFNFKHLKYHKLILVFFITFIIYYSKYNLNLFFLTKKLKFLRTIYFNFTSSIHYFINFKIIL